MASLSNAPDLFAIRDEYAFRLFWGIAVLEIMMGFVHVGILVSYLFQRSRVGKAHRLRRQEHELTNLAQQRYQS